jgi:hypothetical protein
MSRSLAIQGRQLLPDDLELIGRLIADNPDWHRTRLSRELCQLWNWRTDKGLLKDMACRSMLRKLEQRKLVSLPGVWRNSNRARIIAHIAHSCDPVHSELADLRPIQILMIPTRGDTDDLFHCLMDRYHYLGCRGHVGEHIKYIVFDRHNRPLACMLFGSAAWQTKARDLFIGWSPSVRQANLKLMTNNTRFLILPWVVVPNLASFILGACLRRLCDDWQNRYGHNLVLVETFVDRSRFAGTCYHAANWIRIGSTCGRGRQGRSKRVKVPVKDLYIYPLAEDFRQQLCNRV